MDQHTARHIFDKCIKGIFKDKAVIWITHQLELLPEVSASTAAIAAVCSGSKLLED